MISIFSKSKKYIQFSEVINNRKCGTTKDYFYERIVYSAYDKNDKDKSVNELLKKSKNDNLQVIADQLNDYAMHIESILNSKEINQVNNIHYNIIDEITKISELKKNGLLSDEEFSILKEKIINS